MRQSIVGSLFFLCIFAYAGTSLAQEAALSSPPPSIANTSSEETDVLRKLLLLRAKTVYLSVQLEPEAREGPGITERREKRARQQLESAAFQLYRRLKVVKNRKDADLTFLLLEGNSQSAFGQNIMKEKLVVLPGGPSVADAEPLWQSQWHEGEIGGRVPVDWAIGDFLFDLSQLEDTPPEVWIGARKRRPQWQFDEMPDPPVLTAEERRVAFLSAKTIAVLSFGPRRKQGNFFESLLFGHAPPWELADATQSRADVEAALRNWNRYSLVEDPRKADLLLLITVWNEMAEKIDRVQHQDLLAELTIYRGGAFFGNPQVALWQGKESAKSGRSTRRIFEKFRKDILQLEKSASSVGLQPEERH